AVVQGDRAGAWILEGCVVADTQWPARVREEREARRDGYGAGAKRESAARVHLHHFAAPTRSRTSCLNSSSPTFLPSARTFGSALALAGSAAMRSVIFAKSRPLETASPASSWTTVKFP